MARHEVELAGQGRGDPRIAFVTADVDGESLAARVELLEAVDYMIHPHHWAHVDRWFDPESGDQIIDTALCHAYSPMAGAVLSRDAG